MQDPQFAPAGWLIALLLALAVVAGLWWTARRRAQQRLAEQTARLQAQQQATAEREAEALRAAAEAAEAEKAREAAEAARARAQAEAQAREREQAEQRRRQAQAAAEAAEAARLQAEREQAAQLEAQQLEAQRLEAQRREAARREAELIEAQRLEAERRDAARRQAELEAQREAEREAQRLAAQRAEQEAAVAAAATPPAPVSKLVMVADDSKVVRVKTSRLLTQHGYSVVLAEDGAQAAQLLEQEIPLVLVTDVEMPGMDGFELTRHVRQHARASRIPIIMITSADDRLKAAAAEAGVTLVLGKPYAEEALLDCLRQAQAMNGESVALN
jgi:CheY-like chemotaxis protein